MSRDAPCVAVEADRIDLEVAGVRYAFVGSVPAAFAGARARLASRLVTPSEGFDLRTHVTLVSGDPVTHQEPHGLLPGAEISSRPGATITTRWST